MAKRRLAVSGADDLRPKLAGLGTLAALVALYRVEPWLAVAFSVIVGIALVLVDDKPPSWTDISSRSAGGVILIFQAAVSGTVIGVRSIVGFAPDQAWVIVVSVSAVALAWAVAAWIPFALHVVGAGFRTYLAEFPAGMLRQGVITSFVLGGVLCLAASTRVFAGYDYWLTPLLAAFASASIYVGACSLQVALRGEGQRQVSAPAPAIPTSAAIAAGIAIIISFVYGVVVDSPAVWGFALACLALLVPSLLRRDRG